MITVVRQKFKEWNGCEADRIEALPRSGSHREYYRIHAKDRTCLGVFNDSLDENLACFSFTRQFAERNLPVPEILHICPDQHFYFVEDLGDTTLFSLLPVLDPDTPVPENIRNLYRNVLENLIEFQTAGKTTPLNYGHVYPVASFDLPAMQWDLNYFKYFFLKLSGIEFSEPLLQADFDRLCRFLTQSPDTGFMYRDFQSRNIMIRENKPWFIDFQGGRKGPLAYDLASLLYDAKAALPESFRLELLAYYLRIASERIPTLDASGFKDTFYACVLLRIMQAMGAYGLRGLHEKKALFLQSIPYAIRNLTALLERQLIPIPLPEITRIIRVLADSPWASFSKPHADKLTVHLCSFSFREGLPQARDEHGGGFVFDCRFLPNPGRIEKYKPLTGRHPEVRDFFAGHQEVASFLQNCFELVKPAINNYILRDFSSLSLSFGCTGGQHRSVYCAEQMKAMIERHFDISIVLTHLVHPE